MSFLDIGGLDQEIDGLNMELFGAAGDHAEQTSIGEPVIGSPVTPVGVVMPANYIDLTAPSLNGTVVHQRELTYHPEVIQPREVMYRPEVTDGEEVTQRSSVVEAITRTMDKNVKEIQNYPFWASPPIAATPF